jgi:hypothetical protein
MIRLTGSPVITEQAQTAGSTEGFRTSYRQAYQPESAHVAEVNVIQQLRANIAQLEDLHGRLKFMMAEVSYLLKKS